MIKVRFSFRLLTTMLLWLGATIPAIAQQDLQIAPPGELPIGAYYYPEHWSEDQWERDLKRMSELGFTFTHFGEFAWANMEPTEGNFQFEWLDKCVALAAKYGLKVIMCTPTPTPPAWLTEKHPEILSVNEAGFVQLHGSRLHVSYNHPAYLFYVRRIVKKMAERYGQDERIWGWQLDNEPHYGPLYDFSPWQEKQFRTWLQHKYGSIDSLNHAWGAAFWSQSYNHFDQIHLPNANQVSQGNNPHARVDFKRFNAEELATALRFQAELLRENISEKQWITTNYAYFKFLPSVDPFLNRDDLDFASHTMYLTSQYLNDAGDELAHRLGSGMELSFSQEMGQSINGQTGIMELQPGQINWGVINPQPLPGAVRMWVWHATALGDKFICTYRFRQPLFGGEATHYGIMKTDGVTVQRGGEEYVQAIKEINALKWKPEEVESPVSSARKTAFSWSQVNLLDLEEHLHHQDWNPWNHYYTYYLALKRLGAAVEFVTENETPDPAEYPFWVVPAYTRVSEALVEKWKAYAEAGGHLILSCRTGAKDPNGHKWETKEQEPIWDLIGAEIEYFDHLPAAHPGTLSFNGENYAWHIWGDVLNPFDGTETLGTHADQFYQGKASVVNRKLGKGSVTYVGTFSDTGELEYQVLRQRFEGAKAQPFDLPPYVFAEWREGYWICVNYTAKSYDFPLPSGAKIVLGEKNIPPAGVLIWED